MTLLDAEGLVGGYGGATILNGVNLAIERPRDRRHRRPQRRRQVDDAEGDLRAAHSCASARVAFDGEDITNALPDRLVPPRPDLRAAGKQRLHLD